MLLRYKMMPSAGTSPLILLGLQWWPLDPPRGVCPGSASAYRLDEVWVGSSGTARRVKVPPSRATLAAPAAWDARLRAWAAPRIMGTRHNCSGPNQ